MAKIRLKGTVTAQNPIDGNFYKFELEKAGWLSSNGYWNFNMKIPAYAQRVIWRHLKNQLGNLLKGGAGHESISGHQNNYY